MLNIKNETNENKKIFNAAFLGEFNLNLSSRNNSGTNAKKTKIKYPISVQEKAKKNPLIIGRYSFFIFLQILSYFC